MSEAPHKIERMNELAATLAKLEELAGTVAAAAVSGLALRRADEDELVAVLSAASRVQRLVEAVMMEAVGEIAARDERPAGDIRMTYRRGCHNTSELVQRATLLSPVTAGRYLKAAKAVHRETSLITGELLEATLPALRDALGDGVVGLDGALAIATPLAVLGSRVSRDALLAADAVLAAEARGEGPDAAPPACADLLRVQAQVWAMALDPDGSEPRESAAMRKRGLTFGVATDVGVPVRGMLMPEVAAQFRRIADATLHPRVDQGALPGGVQFVEESDSSPAEIDNGDLASLTVFDTRSRAQKMHDVFAMVLGVAAASESLPTIGGAAPTLVVTAREKDLLAVRGSAYLDGMESPVSLTTAAHTACGGVIQRVVLADTGRILSISTEDRVFNRHQRRAIAARDGGCIIPGCGVPPGWCEIHHVTEHADGGPTHTDNGALLCWPHHRFFDHCGWRIRMNGGVPELLAPSWIDPLRLWRAATTSPTRLLNKVLHG